LFQCQKDQQQRHARFLAEQRAVLHEYARRTGKGDERQHPARRQGLAPPGQRGAPEEGRDGDGGEPERHLRRERHEGGQSRRQQPPSLHGRERVQR
jgi:hypothetical protein